MKGSKGIEPVIAVVILIAISIAMAGALFTWYQDTIQSQQSRTSAMLDCAFASLEIENVFLSAESSRVVVENTGQHPLEIGLVILETSASVESFSLNATLESRSLASLPFSYEEECGEFESLTVHTSCSGISARFSGTPTCN